MQQIKKITVIFLLAFTMLLLNGCSLKEKIFVTDETPPSIDPIKKEELEDGDFYIKDGTRFFNVFKPQSNFSSGSDRADTERILWNSEEDDTLIPTLYGDEILAYCTTTSDFTKDFTVERFKDIGYSIGIYGLTKGEKDYYDSTISTNAKKTSDLYSVVSNLNSDVIGFQTIDGKTITNRQVSESGTIKDLEKGKDYEFGLYVGTVYGERKIKADTHIYQSSEIIAISDYRLTQNGYIEITMPEGTKDGFYYIKEVGMFRYLNDRKCVSKSLDKYNYNEKNEDQLLASMAVDDTSEIMTETRSFTIDKLYQTTTISIAQTEGQQISEVLYTSPDGKNSKIYRSKSDENKFEKILEEAPVGEYLVTIKGYNISSIEPNVESNYEILKKETVEKETDNKEATTEESKKTVEESQKENTGSDASTTVSTPSPTQTTETQEQPEVTTDTTTDTIVDDEGYIYYDEPTEAMEGPEQSDTMGGEQ